ncbi:MAG: hypothetical protein HRT41_12165 [Campylobacteraceae bacterium]|nr:hypothetical protein [Campylobacteraceae bacterium]
MNIPVLIVASFTLLAVIAHVFGGTKDSASIIPSKNNSILMRNWKQSMCAFQMLAVDLLLVCVLLFVISLSNLISFEYELTLFLSLLYLMWGIVWLLQLFWIKSNVKTFFILPQWIFWFVGSALLYYGA